MTLMIRGDGEFSYGNMTQWNKYGARQDSSFFYDQEPNEIQTITLHPAQIGQSGLGSLWLEHTMNYTVTFTQLEGPPSDARDGSYKEVDDFILGPMGDWLNSRIFNDGDQDNDGIYDVCDDDIDGDNSKNPIMGGNKGDPESLERALSQCPQAVPMVLEDGQINEEWMIDTNSDGVHVHIGSFSESSHSSFVPLFSQFDPIFIVLPIVESQFSKDSNPLHVSST